MVCDRAGAAIGPSKLSPSRRQTTKAAGLNVVEIEFGVVVFLLMVGHYMAGGLASV